MAAGRRSGRGPGRNDRPGDLQQHPGKSRADPESHNVYDIYAAGTTGFLKARTFTPNHIFVSRSTDMGRTWTANIAFTAPAGTSLGNIFPALAVDPTNGKLYAVWSDGHTVGFSSSSDQGEHWSAAETVSIAPASTAVLPWVAAYNGTVDVGAITARRRHRTSIRARSGTCTLHSLPAAVSRRPR